MRTDTRESELRRIERKARRLDHQAVRLARGRPALDLALGEVFLRLSEGDRLIELGFAKKTDFAHEELGLPPRTFFSLCELASGLRDRPILRRAVLAGAVTPVKARLVMKLAAPDSEAELTAAAMEMTVAELEQRVHDAGGDPEAPPSRIRTLRFRMTPEQQDRLDHALSLAREVVGYDAGRARLTEEVAREWLASGGGTGRPGAEIGAPISVARQLEVLFEAHEVVERPPGGENALALLAQAKRLLARRERFDEPLGRVLAEIARLELWWWLGYGSLGDYCRERLGIAESTARQRIRLERKMRELPALRRALACGRLTFTKAVQVARHATPADVEDRIRAAAGTTRQQTKREADAEEERRDRAEGRRRVRGPGPCLDVVREAIADARRHFAERGERIGEGEAAARIGDHYARVWEKPLRRADWRRRWEREVLLRHGGLCAVPGCTREARHLHHIVYRSRGGPDEPWNTVAVCWAHHRLCIHRGRLTVRGRGGEHLVWTFRTAELTPRTEWETRGRDDVRRRAPGVAVPLLEK